MTEEVQNIAVAEQMVKDALSEFKGATNNTKEAAEVEAAPESSEPSEGRKRPAGYVEVDDPKVKDRIDDLWKQVRKSDEANLHLRGHAQQLENALEQAIKKVEAIENRQHKNDHERALSTLYSQLQEARNIGDDNAIIRLEDQLMDIKLEKRELERQQRQATQDVRNLQRQQPQQTQVYGQEEANYLEELGKETDEDGNALRPWLDKNDKNFDKAVKIAQLHAAEILKETGRLAPVSKIMERVDKEMGGARGASRSGNADVLSGRDLTRSIKENKINLNDEQRFVYNRLDLKKLGIDEKTHAKRQSLIARASRVSIDDF